VRGGYHGENMDYVPIIVVCAWIVSLCVAIFVVPRIAAKKACENFGLEQVTQNGVTFYTPKGLDGKPFKIPIATKEREDGSVEVIEGYAPLAYALPYLAAHMASEKIKMSLLSAKGKISRQLNSAALAGEANFNPATLAAIELLPKKFQGIALMLSQYLGNAQNNQGQASPEGRRGAPNTGKPL
jgi:hypothetical protein